MSYEEGGGVKMKVPTFQKDHQFPVEMHVHIVSPAGTDT